MVDKVNSLLEFFRQKDVFAAELLEHGMTEEEVDALHWTWHDLGWAHTVLSTEQWQTVAGNQQAPHRLPIPQQELAKVQTDPVGFEGKMHVKDNLSSTEPEPFDQQIQIQGDAERAKAAETMRVQKVISRG